MQKLHGMILVVCAIFGSVASYADDKQWVYDEVLTQLHELRGEIKALNSELVQIKAEMKKLSSQGVNGKPAAPELNLSNTYSLGSNKASVAIVEFSDYQCPFCKKHHNTTYSELKRNYIDTGKIRYVMMDFPLSFHREAESAAVAARCAGKQGKFWEMQHALFDTRQSLEDALYSELASNFRLDKQAFDACRNDKSVLSEVTRQLDYGTQLGVQGTPAFFIGEVKGNKLVNTKMLSGAQAYSRFSHVIDTLLQRQ